METAQLEKMKIAAQAMLPSDLADAHVEIITHTMDALIMQVRGYVWGEHESLQRQEIKYPRDWWQAFRERWFPAWWLKRYPVKYREIVLDVKAIYPTFKPSVPNREYRLVIQRY